MAIGMISVLPEGTGAAEYDAVSAKLDAANNPPEGSIFHCAGELDGRFQVFEIWESREAHERFVEDRLRPAIRDVVGEEAFAAMPEAERTETQIHNYQIS
jgi:hypothetical protein